MKNSTLLNVISSTLYYSREWHRREQQNYQFHPVIMEVLDKFTPTDFTLLVLEWPHQSLKDASNVAFTESEAKGLADRQTVTTFGRYIRRHFPEMKDHEIRDFTTKCRNDTFEFWETSDDIVRSVQIGPKSCMSWDSSYTPGSDSYDTGSLHPYRVYDPSLGWKAVVRLDKDSGAVNGRGLVLHQEDGKKIFVRTYKRGSDYSYADEAMEMFLRESGYDHVEEWPEGTKLALIKWGKGVLAPYIDGDNQNASIVGDYLVIKHRGDYDCTSTEGNPYGYNSLCECCDDYYDSDEMTTARNENGYEIEVCSCCLDDYFRYAAGRHGRSNYHHEDAVTELANGDYIVTAYLSDNGVVETKDGDYEYEHDCVKTTGGDWVLDSDIDYIVVKGVAYEIGVETYECAADGCTYVTALENMIEVDGDTYHPNNVPETEKE